MAKQPRTQSGEPLPDPSEVINITSRTGPTQLATVLPPDPPLPDPGPVVPCAETPKKTEKPKRQKLSTVLQTCAKIERMLKALPPKTRCRVLNWFKETSEEDLCDPVTRRDSGRDEG